MVVLKVNFILVFLVGTILVVLSKVIIKKVMECLVIGLYRMFEIEFYTSNKRRLYFNTGYGKHFILPPVNYEVSSSYSIELFS